MSNATTTMAVKPSPLLVTLAYVGFVSLGLPDAVIGVAWPSVRDFFRLPQSTLGLVLVASGCGYFLSSFFSGRVVHALVIGLIGACWRLIAAERIELETDVWSRPRRAEA